jgi:glycosyltransferase involved in cell wall biosynthesis
MPHPNKKITLHWYNEGMTTYTNDFFRALAQDPDIDLLVHYRFRSQKTHPWRFSDSVGYKYRCFIHPTIIPDLRALLSGLRPGKSYYIFSNSKGITKRLLLLLMVLSRRRFAYNTDTLPGDYLTETKGLIFRKFLLNFVYAFSDKILTTGRCGVKQFEKLNAPGSKLVNFPYFIDIPSSDMIVNPDARNNPGWKNLIDAEDFVFLCSGQHIVRKGFDLVIRALRRVIDKTENKSIKLLIAGEGTERTNLEALVRSLRLEENVFLLGWLQPEEVKDFYPAGDVFVHMARLEPYGVVILEAMAYGMPVIASTATMAGIDRIKDGVNGFIVRNENTEALSDKMIHCVLHKNLIEEIGTAARKTAEDWPVSKGVQIIREVVLS